MSDLCRVFLVGNLSQDFMHRRDEDGTVYGVTTVCIGQTELIGGVPVATTVGVPIEVRGASRLTTAAQFGAGNRVLVEGH